LPDLDLADVVMRVGTAPDPFDGLGKRLALQDPVTGDELLRLSEGAVDYGTLVTGEFMVMVKATKDSEAGKLPSEEVLSTMAKFNEEMVKAGVMLDANGLQPSSKGARVRFRILFS
jgi:hypothetical protein